jgi:excinuclease UvrABC nuclease subunit
MSTTEKNETASGLLSRFTHWAGERGVSGVYLLYAHGEILYVGTSHNIAERIETHDASNRIPFRTVEFLAVNDRIERHAIERALIAHLKPRFNIRSKDNKGRTTVIVSFSLAKKTMKAARALAPRGNFSAHVCDLIRADLGDRAAIQ